MADLLQRGMQWLSAQRRAHMAREVEYRRGAMGVTLSATVGRTAFESADEHGVIRRSESRDYLITATDLVLNGVRVEPKAGDQVRELVDQEWLVYAVGAPASAGEPPFRWCGSERLTLRVHTHLIGREPLEPA